MSVWRLKHTCGCAGEPQASHRQGGHDWDEDASVNSAQSHAAFPGRPSGAWLPCSGSSVRARAVLQAVPGQSARLRPCVRSTLCRVQTSKRGVGAPGGWGAQPESAQDDPPEAPAGDWSALDAEAPPAQAAAAQPASSFVHLVSPCPGLPLAGSVQRSRRDCLAGRPGLHAPSCWRSARHAAAWSHLRRPDRDPAWQNLRAECSRRPLAGGMRRQHRGQGSERLCSCRRPRPRRPRPSHLHPGGPAALPLAAGTPWRSRRALT